MNHEINDYFARAAKELNDAIRAAVCEDMKAFMSKSPEEYGAWKKARDRENENKEHMRFTRQKVSKLREELAYYEPILSRMELEEAGRLALAGVRALTG